MPIFYSKFEKYIKYLEGKNIKLDYSLINKYFKRDSVELFDGILFYTGFSGEPWNLSYSEKHALGGSEQAVINLAKQLSDYYPIVISGDVKEEVLTNYKNPIKFIHRFK